MPIPDWSKVTLFKFLDNMFLTQQFLPIFEKVCFKSLFCIMITFSENCIHGCNFFCLWRHLDWYTIIENGNIVWLVRFWKHDTIVNKSFPLLRVSIHINGIFNLPP